MKKIIITGATRTGTTALASLLSYSPKILVTNELGMFDHNPTYYHTRSAEWVETNESVKEVLSRKGLTLADINDFLTGNFKNKGSLEFFGDKFPTYCSDREYCKHMVQYHSEAYFIFTYRNPYATIYSGKYRSKLQESHSHADWFFKNLEESVQQLKTFILNWSNFIYPYVEKKIIIDYDKYVNNVDLLKADLSTFLGIDIEVSETLAMNSTSTPLDVSYIESRGLFRNTKLDAYKEGLSIEETNYIFNNLTPYDILVKDLISKQ